MTIQRSSWSWDRTEYALTQFFSSAELVQTLVRIAGGGLTHDRCVHEVKL